MRKLVLAIAILLSATASMAEEKILNWGIEAGMNFNTLRFDKDMFESSNRLGFFVGPKIKVNSPLLGFGADAALLYSLNSAQVYFHDTDYSGIYYPSDMKRNKSMSYIEVPMNIRYTFGISVISLYLATGPQFNYCVSSDNTVRDLFYGHVPYDYSRATWGWNFGGGIEIVNHVQLGVTYTMPISNNGNLSWSDVDNLFSSYTQSTVKVRLAYYF